MLVALIGLTALWRRSEHQRGRAEAALARALDGEATADAAVADLVALLRGAVEAPERFSSERTGDATSAVLALAAKLRRTPELAARHAVAIARLELRLVGYRLRAGDRDGVRRLLDDGLLLLDARPDRPAADADADVARAEILLRRGDVALQFAHPAEAAEDVRRAERALAPHAGDPRALDAFVALRSTHDALANAMAASAGPDAGRRASLADAEMFREWARRSGDPTLRLLAAIARQGAEPAPGAERATSTDDVWREFDRLPDDAPIPHGLVVLLADLAARGLCESATADAMAGRDAEATARRVLAQLDAQFARRLPSTFRPEVLERLSQLGCTRAFEDRRDGRLEESRRDASWMIALARALTARDADSVGAHLMLSRALEQEAKNAWAVPDLRAVERSLRAALTEAAAAFELAPDDETCRLHLAGLREKFVRLVAAEPDR
ncbi:hypothetical protein [Planctomyces sp. SH-PL62]|uniref:hypothetical protein n=1 Tax=Planctomyces sp. SH-PL62 TaxID=1636152 RepID=UPI00078D5789|nr:hypothetical protein [Planctomyces sp. SH-PL62]AMV40604.1 hypothetical protein VT85_24450 [Planctomyces sp. SH-PL62]